MLRTIHLHGRLGEVFGRTHRLAVDSTAEAVHALMTLFPKFGPYIRPRSYVVSIGEGTVIDTEQLTMRLGSTKDIHITPAGMVSGIETIILGVALGITALLSVAMILMMPKAPKAVDREDSTKTASFVFDGPQNVTEQGHPVPLVYGQMRVGSVMVSAGIATTDVNQASISTDPTDPTFSGDPGDPAPPYEFFVGSSPGLADSPSGSKWTVGKGGKAGGGTGRSAQEDPNSLQSQATARILEVVSEGEIVGLVDGMKSVYFDNTQLQNPDGTFNFAGVAIEQRVGLPDQDFVPGFTQTENSIAVNTEVKVSTGSVTRSITDPDATVARVTIRLPQLYAQDTENGDLKASSVAVKVSVQADGGGFSEVTTMTFDGKTNSGYQRSIDVRLPVGTSRDIRVTRVTADSAVTSLQNQTYFDLLTEIVEAKLSYPDTALIGLTVDARQFGSSIPERSYVIKGIIVEVPTNYDPVTRVYTGVWDGTFKRAWTDNPAWVFRDIVLARRYGLGTRVPAGSIDKWDLYAIAQHCDALIPDGFGGTSPRYTINCCINNPAAAYDVLASIASNFRGMVYWGSGTINLAQDRPEDPSVLLNRSNVVDGVIDYGRVTPLERRRSVSVVYWNDPEDGYKLSPEIYEDATLVRRLGRRTGDFVTAFGVTNRGQAHRMCRWILEDEAQASNTTASYQVGDDHGFVEPGRIAALADPMHSADRRGGRAVSSTANSVTIDAPFTFVGGQTYKLRVMLPNGTVSLRDITNAAGAATVVTLSGSAFAINPNPGAVWTIESSVLANQQFRVRSIETDDAPYRVQAVSHDPTKYARVEADRDLSVFDMMTLPSGGLEPPGAIGSFEFLQQEGTASIPCVQVSWIASPDPRVLFYQAMFKRPGGSWEPFADGSDLSRTVRNAEPGLWEFQVRALDSLGRKTAWVATSETLDGQTDTLPEVSAPGLVINSDSFAAKLVWDAPTDTRPLRYEVLYHASSTSLGSAASLGITDQLSFPILNPGNYWVRTTFIGFTSPSPTRLNVPAIVFSAGIVPSLTNEAFQVPTDEDGVVSSYTGASGSFVIYSGTDDVSSSFTLSTPSGGNPQSLTVGYVARAYSVTAGLDAAEPTATLRIRATGSGDFTGVVLDKVFSLSKAQQGRSGDYKDTKFLRSLAQPATPTGDNPVGWSDGVPGGTDTLWQIVGIKTAAGTLINIWSTPQAISGLTPRGPYVSTDTYYLNNTTTFGGGSYIALQDNFSGHAPSGTASANAYWDVLASPGEAGTPATPPSAFSATINLTSGPAVNLRDVADANGYTGASDATITFNVPSGVTIRGLNSGGIGLDTGTWPSGYTIALTLVVQSGGVVDGGGGNGGSSGTGGWGGDAIYVREAMTGGITINSGGAVRGGGGGGGGRLPTGSGSKFGGGGGGGGAPNGDGGFGGSGWTADGADGDPGSIGGGGAGGAPGGGAGGGFATAGTAASDATPAGQAGYAVRKNGYAVTVTNSGTMTGTAA